MEWKGRGVETQAYRSNGGTLLLPGGRVMDVAPHHHHVVERQAGAHGKVLATQLRVDLQCDVCEVSPLGRAQFGGVQTLRRNAEIGVAHLLDLA